MRSSRPPLRSLMSAAWLVACGGAPVVATTTRAPAPDTSLPALPATYPPGDDGWFDVVAHGGGLHVYGAMLGEDLRLLQRFDLDLEGRPSRAAPIALEDSADAPVAVVVAAAAVGERDLVVLCDEAADGAMRYRALWVDAAGRAIETVDLGTFAAEEGVYAPCFVRVAPSGVDRAVAIVGRDSLACPREASDDDITQCPGYRAVTLSPGRPLEDRMRVGTADALPRLAGTEAGWAWGLGPYPFAASIVLSYGSIPFAPHLLDAHELDGFVATPDTIVALVRVERGRVPSIAAFRGEEVPTGATANLADELPVIPAARALSCVDGAVTASIAADAFSITVRAGAERTSVPWLLFLDAEPRDRDPDPGTAAADGRVYAIDRLFGELTVLGCEDEALASHVVAWRAEPADEPVRPGE